MRKNPYALDSDQWRAWQRGYAACHLDWKETAAPVRKAKPRRWRDSILGRWVSKPFADSNPDTTQGERG